MPPRERPLGSRVREIRTHGLIGGLTEMLAVLASQESRIYQ
jgi:hypothetical protein